MSLVALTSPSGALAHWFWSLPAALYTCDAQGRIEFFNPAAVELWGREPTAGQDLWCGSWKIYNPDGTSLPIDECPMAVALREGRSVRGVEIVIERPDGTRRSVLPYPDPLRDQQGRIVGAINMLVDLTELKQVQGAERQSRARLAAIVESSSDAIVGKSLDGIIHSWNAGAQRLFGYTEEEVVGRPITLLIPPERQHEEQMILGRISRGERVEHYETVRVAKGGRRIDISLTVSPVRDESGRIIGASKVARDITESKRVQRELQNNNERFQRLANAVPAVIWTADSDGTITFASDRWYEYTGLTPEENATDWPRRVLHGDDYDRCVAAWTAALASGENYEIEVRNKRQDGEYRWWLTRAMPIKDADGRTLEWFGSSLDIHDLKLAEQALQDADRRKDEFLATLAHELRNPLAPIRNSLHLLKITSGDDSVVKIHDMLERQVSHMVRLVDDLLEVSRIGRGKIALRRERVALAAIIRSAVEAGRPLIDAAEQQLTVSLPAEPLFLDADPVRLAQVVCNLLNNATKYTPRGGEIWLSAARREGELAISVRDTGIGIPAEELPTIFEMFKQLDRGREVNNSGLGIGLNLASRLVQLHGGRIEAKSDGPEQGSEFTIHLPLAAQGESDADLNRTSAAPLVAPPDSPQQPPRHRVMIVDDNRDAANSLGMLLSLMSADVAVVHDGASALEMLPKHRPTIILLDIGMPGMDGFEVASRVRAHPAGEGVKLVALTGWGQESDRYRIRESGFDLHLVKPADMSALEALLEGSED